MGKLKIILSLVFLSVSITVKAYNVDTLKRDSLLQTTGIKVVFKAGSAYKTNDNGFVIEGVPAFDTELWSTGPLVLFSSNGFIRLNSSGKVTQGVLAANILAECPDNKYREFRRGSRIFFDRHGIVFRGSPFESITTTIDNQIIHSAENSPIEFYQNGKIKFITPSTNIKITSYEGVKVVLSANSPIKLSENGSILSGYLAKKVNFSRQKENINLSFGQQIHFDENGSIIY